MPPKKPRTPKVDPEELARLRAEEEAAAAAAEAARVEAIRQRAEQRQQALDDRVPDLVAQATELEGLYSEHRRVLEEAAAAQRELGDWESFQSCSLLPFAHDTAAITQFVFEWQERRPVDGAAPADVVAQCQQAEELAQASLACAHCARQLEEGGKGAEEHLAMVALYRTVTANKIDEVTSHVLQYAEEHMQPYEENPSLRLETADLNCCIWANVGKNPLIPEVDFVDAATKAATRAAEQAQAKALEEGQSADEMEGLAQVPPPKPVFQVQLPEPLRVASIAIRLVLTSFNPFTTFAPRGAPPSVATSVFKLYRTKEEETPHAPEEENGDGDGDGDGGSAPPVEGTGNDAAATPAAATPAPSPAPTPTPTPTPAAGAGATEPDMAKIEEEAEDSPEDGGPSAGAAEDQPADEGEEMAASGIVKEEEEEQVPLPLSLHQHTPVGPTLRIDLLKLPPSAIVVNKWTIRQVPAGPAELQPLSYPLPGAPRVPIPGSEETAEPRAGTAAWPALQVRIPWLDNVVLGAEGPVLAYWDEAESAWMGDGFSNVALDPEGPSLVFETTHFAPTTLITERCRYHRVLDWSLHPTPAGAAVFRIVGEHHTTVLSCTEAGVTLVSPALPALKPFMERAWEPEELIQALVNVGFNVFPGLDVEGQSSKDAGLEAALYHQMALLSRTFCFVESVWNADAEAAEMLLRAARLAGETPPSADYTTLRVSAGTLVYEPACAEGSTSVSADVKDGATFHATLLGALLQGSTNSLANDIQGPKVAQAVWRLLQAVRPLSTSEASAAKAFAAEDRARMEREEEEARLKAEEAATRLAAEGSQAGSRKPSRVGSRAPSSRGRRSTRASRPASSGSNKRA